jgi:hypothetical protein
MKFDILKLSNSVFWRRYFNIDNRYFKIHKISLKLLGLTRRDFFGILFHCFSFGCIVYCEFFGILYIFRHRKNVLEVAEAFGTKLTAFLGTVKMLTFLLSYGEIELLRKEVEALGEGGLHLMFTISSKSHCFLKILLSKSSKSRESTSTTQKYRHSTSSLALQLAYSTTSDRCSISSSLL